MSELKRAPVVCLVSPTSDAALKLFQTSSKNIFPSTFLFCQLKSAIDLACKQKPPLVKTPQPDLLSLPGDLVSVVVRNWLMNQLRKPVPKAAASKKNTGKKPTKQQSSSNIEIQDNDGQYVIFVTDYPKTQSQAMSMVLSACPIVCQVTVEIANAESERKTPLQSEPRQVYSGILPTRSISLSSNSPNDEQISQLVNDIAMLHRALQAYHDTFKDTKFIVIPDYPSESASIPQISQPPQKGVTPSHSKLQIESPSLVQESNALISAYKFALMSQIEEFMTPHTAEYMHASEFLPRLPMPAEVKAALSSNVDTESPEVYFIMEAAYGQDISHQVISSVLVEQRFGDLIQQKVGHRRHTENIPLSVLPYVFAKAYGRYDQFRTCEFEGKILLAFHHGMPKDLPLSSVSEVFHLPVYQGVGTWVARNYVDSDQEESPNTNEETHKTTDVATLAGSDNAFFDMPSNTSTRTVKRYFDENGILVESYPAAFTNGVMSDLSFMVDSQAARFTFNISQKPSKQANEEEDELETTVCVRGVLGAECDMVFDNTGDTASLLLNIGKSNITFDAATGTISMAGSEKETHRIISRNGEIIIYTPDPVIYRPDGTILQYADNKWTMITLEGEAFVNNGAGWFRTPGKDVGSEIISSHFVARKVTKRSDGLSIFEENSEVQIRFPDGTRYALSERRYTHTEYPDIVIDDEAIIIENGRITATFDDDRNCVIDMKQGSCSFSFKEESRHLIISYGEFKNFLTLIDLVTGIVANVGGKRLIYYLTEDFEWAIGRQLCSKKEIVQHFQDGDFVDRLQPVTQVENDEIEAIMSTGHKPRLFIVDKDMPTMKVAEILAEADFQAMLEKSSTRVSKKNEQEVVLWFDTQPKTFRETSIGTKVNEEMRAKVYRIVEEQKNREKERTDRLNSVGDPKWKIIEKQLEEQENNLWDMLQKDYGIARPHIEANNNIE